MKIHRTSLIIVLTLMLLSGCSTGNKKNYDTNNIPTVVLSELSVSYEDAKNAFVLCNNIEKSDNLSIDVPVNIPEVYEYTSSVPSNIDMNKYYDEFLGMFEYLFPNKKINDEFLLYMGGSSRLEYNNDGTIKYNYNKVSEWLEKILSGEEGRVNFIYDETWFRDLQEQESPVCLELGNPIGYGYAVINKGKTVELSNSKVYDDKQDIERYPLLESYDPSEWLSYVGTYPTDSSKKYKLADKEISISEAVAFFEQNINNLPYPKDKDAKTSVVGVEVYQVSKDIFGYYFLTTKEYCGVKFDYMRSGTSHSRFDDYSAVGGNAFMVESNDIDVVYGYYQLQGVEDEISYDTIISIESAAQIISEKMTSNVVFEAQKIELVYTSKPAKTEEGLIDTSYPSSKVVPAWKLTLYNPNDALLYVCYVDAVDGQNFRYYTTPYNQSR